MSDYSYHFIIQNRYDSRTEGIRGKIEPKEFGGMTLEHAKTILKDMPPARRDALIAECLYPQIPDKATDSEKAQIMSIRDKMAEVLISILQDNKRDFNNIRTGLENQHYTVESLENIRGEYQEYRQELHNQWVAQRRAELANRQAVPGTTEGYTHLAFIRGEAAKAINSLNTNPSPDNIENARGLCRQYITDLATYNGETLTDEEVNNRLDAMFSDFETAQKTNRDLRDLEDKRRALSPLLTNYTRGTLSADQFSAFESGYNQYYASLEAYLGHPPADLATPRQISHFIAAQTAKEEAEKAVAGLTANPTSTEIANAKTACEAYIRAQAIHDGARLTDDEIKARVNTMFSGFETAHTRASALAALNGQYAEMETDLQKWKAGEQPSANFIKNYESYYADLAEYCKNSSDSGSEPANLLESLPDPQKIRDFARAQTEYETRQQHKNAYEQARREFEAALNVGQLTYENRIEFSRKYSSYKTAFENYFGRPPRSEELATLENILGQLQKPNTVVINGRVLTGATGAEAANLRGWTTELSDEMKKITYNSEQSSFSISQNDLNKIMAKIKEIVGNITDTVNGILSRNGLPADFQLELDPFVCINMTGSKDEDDNPLPAGNTREYHKTNDITLGLARYEVLIGEFRKYSIPFRVLSDEEKAKRIMRVVGSGGTEQGYKDFITKVANDAGITITDMTTAEAAVAARIARVNEPRTINNADGTTTRITFPQRGAAAGIPISISENTFYNITYTLPPAPAADRPPPRPEITITALSDKAEPVAIDGLPALARPGVAITAISGVQNRAINLPELPERPRVDLGGILQGGGPVGQNRPLPQDPAMLSNGTRYLSSRQVSSDTGITDVEVPEQYNPDLKDVPVVTPANFESVPGVTPANLKDVPVVTPANLKDVPVVTPANLKDVPVVTPANLKDVPVVTPANTIPPDTLTTGTPILGARGRYTQVVQNFNDPSGKYAVALKDSQGRIHTPISSTTDENGNVIYLYSKNLPADETFEVAIVEKDDPSAVLTTTGSFSTDTAGGVIYSNDKNGLTVNNPGEVDIPLTPAQMAHNKAEEARVVRETAAQEAVKASNKAEEARVVRETAAQEAVKASNKAEEARVVKETAEKEAAEAHNKTEAERVVAEQAAKEAAEAHNKAEEERVAAETAAATAAELHNKTEAERVAAEQAAKEAAEAHNKAEEEQAAIIRQAIEDAETKIEASRETSTTVNIAKLFEYGLPYGEVQFGDGFAGKGSYLFGNGSIASYQADIFTTTTTRNLRGGILTQNTSQETEYYSGLSFLVGMSVRPINTYNMTLDVGGAFGMNDVIIGPHQVNNGFEGAYGQVRFALDLKFNRTWSIFANGKYNIGPGALGAMPITGSSTEPTFPVTHATTIGLRVVLP